MDTTRAPSLTAEQRRDVDAWIESNLVQVPTIVATFLTMHRPYLKAEKDLRQRFNETLQQLRVAMGLIPSSERRRSGHPMAKAPGKRQSKTTPLQTLEKLEQDYTQATHLGDWHDNLKNRHTRKAKRIEEKMKKLKSKTSASTSPQEGPSNLVQWPEDAALLRDLAEEIPLDSIELTEEEEAQTRENSQALLNHLKQGSGPDPSLQSAEETLMPGGSVVVEEGKVFKLAAVLPPGCAGSTEIKTLTEERVRYNLSLSVTPVILQVEKKVVVKKNGERTVISAPTHAYGPPRFRVTWSTLSTLAVLVGQYALPLNRLGTMFSTTDKAFSASGLSRMLHYVAMRWVPIYLYLAEQLAESDILSGDDTPSRVVEVSTYFREQKAMGEKEKSEVTRETSPPWSGYRAPEAAEASLFRCKQHEQERLKRREEGDREARRSLAEKPTLGMRIGRILPFESVRQNGGGPKKALNTTVMTGRSDSDDPRSMIVFYRSHVGGCGNLLEALLRRRSSTASRKVIFQSDLSATNHVKDPALLERWEIQQVGCSAHARRPFAQYEHEDPVYGPFMVHLMMGPAIHEKLLDEIGRNQENVLAVRQNDSRRHWEDIRELATTIAERWTKGTKLGAAARYILNHFKELTAYLDDPRLDPTNNFRERMLRTERLIENNSLFRRTLEGRFVLDVIRTMVQTAVAAGIPVLEYLTAILQANPQEIEDHPEKFTPRAWISQNQSID